MKAITYERFGDLDVLELRELPEPTCGPGEVVVAVRAASINPVDGKIRRGELKFLSGRKFPKRPGSDFAGVVQAVGSDVREFSPGDAVFGVVPGLGGGAYAEVVVTTPALLAKKPANLSFEEAAAVPVVGFAALYGLRELGGIGRESRVLINGAAGGVGTFAVQLAKLLGATVTATASGSGLALVRELGADTIYDYREVDITAIGATFDLIFELSGRLPFAQARRILTPRGALINPTPTPALLIGSALANPLRRQKHRMLLAQPSTPALRWLAEELAAGRLRCVVDRCFDLAEVHAAVAYAETGKIRGKVVLRIPGGPK